MTTRAQTSKSIVGQLGLLDRFLPLWVFLAMAAGVLIFLGIPLAAGIITRFEMRRRRGDEWYENYLMPRLGPTALIGLLFTIVVMFSMQGDQILDNPVDVLRVAIPLWFISC